MTAKILDEPYTNEQDEMVYLSLKAMSFDTSISFVLSLEKTKMRIGAHLADESETAKEMFCRWRASMLRSRKIKTDASYTNRLNQNDKLLLQPAASFDTSINVELAMKANHWLWSLIKILSVTCPVMFTSLAQDWSLACTKTLAAVDISIIIENISRLFDFLITEYQKCQLKDKFSLLPK